MTTTLRASPILFAGDCLETMAQFAARGEKFHACICDPPYELAFMGRKWDQTGVAFRPETWRAVYDVLLPGAYLLAFGGTRTSHRITCAIEDAGFEIRDTICWLYGSGFPKSLNVAKAIDKADRGVPQGGADPTSLNHGKYKSGCSDENPSGRGFGAGPGAFMAEQGEAVTRMLVPEALPWVGFGTALKPAFEPIIVARKSFEGTVAANVLKHSCGALNIDACRVEGIKDVPASPRRAVQNTTYGDLSRDPGTGSGWDKSVGRWPANVIHDGSEEVLEYFPESKGQLADVSATAPSARSKNVYGKMSREGEASSERRYINSGGTNFAVTPGQRRFDAGSAARFFYCAKAGKADRAGSKHPTVKPISLMRYLCRLVTPLEGRIIDPFAGSGTTLQAAHEEGFAVVGCEQEPEYVVDIERRIAALNGAAPKPWFWPLDYDPINE